MRSSIAQLEARGWGVDPDGADYTLWKDLSAYRADADGVIAAARLAAERPDATPDELMGLVNAIDAAPTADQPPDFAAVAARFAALGWRLEATGDDRYVMRPPAPHPGIANSTWYGVTSRLAAIERAAQIGYPPDFDQARERAAQIGLILDRNDDDYSLKNLHGSGVERYDWPGILVCLANREHAHAEQQTALAAPDAVRSSADFEDMQTRFAALGWDFRAPGNGTYVLHTPSGSHYATTPDLAPQLRSLAVFEAAAAKRAADGLPPLPTQWPAAQVAIPADIAQAAAQLALVVEVRDGGRLLLFWPDEAVSLGAMDPLPPDVMREWLASDAPRQAMQRAETLGWKAGIHKRAGQIMHAYARAADGRETAEYADQALAAGEALRIAARDPLAACATCGQPSAGRRNIGGTLAERCAGCATAHERDDLSTLLDEQYGGTNDATSGLARHHIDWTGGASGDYSYDDALAMLHASATQLRQATPPTPGPAGAGDPREAARAWLDSTRAVLTQAAPGTMFRASEMREAAGHVAALLDEGERERRRAIVPIAERVIEAETWLGHDLSAPHLPRVLADCRKRLDALAGGGTIEAAAYDDWSRRLDDTLRALAESELTESERGSVPTVADLLNEPPFERIRREVDLLRDLIAVGRAGPGTTDQLCACRRQLDVFADDPAIGDAEFDALMGQIGKAERDWAELAEIARPGAERAGGPAPRRGGRRWRRERASRHSRRHPRALGGRRLALRGGVGHDELLRRRLPPRRRARRGDPGHRRASR